MACVGIFDSGLGGLTVWSALRQHVPELPCLYLADQAHLPYGPRSSDEIRQLCVSATQALLDQGARLIVIACNTASAAALEHLRASFQALPFVGMEPAVKPAALHTRSGVVGLMATRGTLQGALLRNTAARFAGHVIGQVQPHTELLTKPVRSAGFAVLKAPDMPSVLIETGFLSNRQDEKVLQDSAHRAKLARSIVGAVDQFFAAEQTWSRL